MICDGPPSHLDSFWVVARGLKLNQRTVTVICGSLWSHEKMALLYEEDSCASRRKWTWSRGTCSDYEGCFTVGFVLKFVQDLDI